MTAGDPTTPEEPRASDGPVGLGRRAFLGTAAAVSAAVVWTGKYPFAGAAIGQTLRPQAGPTGPAGPTGTSGTGTTGTTGTVPSGSTGTATTGTTGTTGGSAGTLAFTGFDASAAAAAGAASVAAGAALVWFRRRGGTEPTP